MPNGRGVGDDVMERAHARLVLCRDLTDDAQADCQVISDLLAALRAARKDTERLEQIRTGGYLSALNGCRTTFLPETLRDPQRFRDAIDSEIAEESDVHS